MTRMSNDAEALAAGAQRAARRVLAETRDLRRAWEQLAMLLVQERTPAQLAGALAASALDAVMDAPAADDAPAAAAASADAAATLARVRAVAAKWDKEFDGYSGGGAMLDEFLTALAGPPGEDFATAGPPHPTAAARAKAAAEQLPTVGRWHADRFPKAGRDE